MIQHNWAVQKNATFSVKARLRSFVYAWKGIIHFFKNEHNAQLHLASTIIVVVLAFIYRPNATEIIFLAFAIGFVWIAEMLNTAFEKTMDFISLESHQNIKHIKDLAAGAVLIASIIALITGLVIFIPKILAS